MKQKRLGQGVGLFCPGSTLCALQLKATVDRRETDGTLPSRLFKFRVLLPTAGIPVPMAVNIQQHESYYITGPL